MPLSGRYTALLTDIKQRIRTAQMRTAMAANTGLLMLYWEIGGVLAKRQASEGWGARVLPRLAADLHNALPEVQGFSDRNMRLMIQFYEEYPGLFPIWQPPVAKLKNPPVSHQKETRIAARSTTPPEAAAIWQPAVAKLPWAHNVALFQKVKDRPTRLWYAQQSFEHGWSRQVLFLQIQNRAHERQGKAVTNFTRTLPAPQSDLAAQLLKDPYVFDFLSLEKPFHERELETGLLRHLQEFLVALGTGFAWVGRQVHLEVGSEDFYIDLLFYHLRLRCFVVIDLKVGRFRPEYAGKMNFYLNAVDDRLRHATDQPSIGLILCEDKNKVVAEYALRGLDKAIGVSAYELTRALPKTLQSALPSIVELESELSRSKDAKPVQPDQGARPRAPEKLQTQGRKTARLPAGNSARSAGSSTKPSVPTRPAKSPEVLIGSGRATVAPRSSTSSRTGRKYARGGRKVTASARGSARSGFSTRPEARAKAGRT
jgi:predicted nuclease of restriction endonuclease-like (RecB) superfamily